MDNLFWKTKHKTTKLLSTDFKSEDEFEKMVFDTKEIFDDLYLIKRQIRGGNKPGIPDIVGVDKSGNICIIEMKKNTVDASIIPQVLSYAIWAEQHPDSIKNLWLEDKNKPEDISISWDNFQVRIIVIAPDIQRSTLDSITKINYKVDLVEIKKWIEGDNQWLLIHKLEENSPKKIKTARGMRDYDEEFYLEQ